MKKLLLAATVDILLTSCTATKSVITAARTTVHKIGNNMSNNAAAVDERRAVRTYVKQ